MNKLRILVVEDEVITSKYITRILTTQGYTVVGVAITGAEAIKKSLQIAPDILLVDIKLKGEMDGIEAAREILQQSQIPVIFITASYDDMILQRAKEVSPYGYIIKPFKQIELKMAIELAIHNHTMEKKLRESEKQYRKIFEESKDVIYISNMEGRFIDVNFSGVELLGYDSKDELMGVDIEQYVYARESDRLRFKQLIEKQGFVKDLELELKRKDGVCITVLLTSTPIRDDSGKQIGFRGIIHDISARVENERLQLKMNAELLDANEKLKQTQSTLIQQEKLASIGLLAAGVAHELNNPIGFVYSNFNTLKSYLNTIREYLGKTEKLMSCLKLNKKETRAFIVEELIEYKKAKKLDFILDDIDDIFLESKEGLERVIKIVENLRCFSRIDSEGKVQSYDLNIGIESTLDVARNELKYIADVQKDLTELPTIEAIGGEINQVLLNIIINAAQAIESMNRKERGTISIRTYPEGDFVVCEIADDGPGIPEDKIIYIFEPFFTTKDSGKGTGLGLSISNDIILNKHHGELKVQSEVGKGTTFTMKLPLQSGQNNRNSGNFSE